MNKLAIVTSKLFTFIFVAVVYFAINSGVVWAEAYDCIGETSLPNNYQIDDPSPDVPEAIARFSGIWVGYWKDGGKDALCHILIIEEVNSEGKAKVVYSTGTYAPWRINTGSYGRFEGEIGYGELSFILENGYRVSYRINSDDELMGNYNYGSSFGTFERQ